MTHLLRFHGLVAPIYLPSQYLDRSGLFFFLPFLLKVQLLISLTCIKDSVKLDLSLAEHAIRVQIINYSKAFKIFLVICKFVSDDLGHNFKTVEKLSDHAIQF